MNVYYVDVRRLTPSDVELVGKYLTQAAFITDAEFIPTGGIASYRAFCEYVLTPDLLPVECPVVDVSNYDLDKIKGINQLRPL